MHRYAKVDVKLDPKLDVSGTSQRNSLFQKRSDFEYLDRLFVDLLTTFSASTISRIHFNRNTVC